MYPSRKGLFSEDSKPLIRREPIPNDLALSKGIPFLSLPLNTLSSCSFRTLLECGNFLILLYCRVRQFRSPRYGMYDGATRIDISKSFSGFFVLVGWLW